MFCHFKTFENFYFHCIWKVQEKRGVRERAVPCVGLLPNAAGTREAGTVQTWSQSFICLSHVVDREAGAWRHHLLPLGCAAAGNWIRNGARSQNSSQALLSEIQASQATSMNPSACPSFLLLIIVIKERGHLAMQQKFHAGDGAAVLVSPDPDESLFCATVGRHILSLGLTCPV